jgi:hypothetical protein
MQTIHSINGHDAPIRWTTSWVVLVSALTPFSAWLLHTVQPEAVPIYLGIMALLTLTPDRRPKWLKAQQEVVQSQNLSVLAATTQTLVVTKPADGQEPTKPEENAEGSGTKARKPRARGKKPKTVTLAEVRSLNSNADRAVVWSQVGPGKFVRQNGAGNGEGSDEAEATDEQSPANYSAPVMIEAVGKRVEIETEDEEGNE